MESLTDFIRSNPDPRELKRALAVKMVQQNYSYYQIRDTLGVSLGFILRAAEMWTFSKAGKALSGLNHRIL